MKVVNNERCRNYYKERRFEEQKNDISMKDSATYSKEVWQV